MLDVKASVIFKANGVLVLSGPYLWSGRTNGHFRNLLKPLGLAQQLRSFIDHLGRAAGDANIPHGT